MGILGFTSIIGTALIGYGYASYATFTALTGRPATNADVERWLHYWCVMGIVTAILSTFEWTIRWLPLYYELKFMAVLWLTLSQGSTTVYTTYLEPFYVNNTKEIDQLIASAHTNFIAFAQRSFQAVWAFILARLSSAQSAAAENQGPAPGAPGNPAANGPLQGMAGVWKQFGPSILASGASLLSPAANKQAAQQAVASQSFPDPNAYTGASGVGGNPATDQLRFRSTGSSSTNDAPPFPIPVHMQQ